MNHLAKLFLAGCAVASLTACEDLRGTLEVKQVLSVKTKKETRTLTPGTLEVGISLKDATSMVLKVKVPNEKVAKFEIKVPRGIPSQNGAFESVAGENGQTFGVLGEVKTEHSNSAVQRNYRSCTVPVSERECYNQPVTECGVNAHGEKICKTRNVVVCRDVVRYISGHEIYDGYTAYRSQYMRASLVDPSTKTELARLNSGDTDSSFIETWRSGCIVGPYPQP